MILLCIQVVLALLGLLALLAVYTHGKFWLGFHEVSNPFAAIVGVVLLTPIPVGIFVLILTWTPAIFEQRGRFEDGKLVKPPAHEGMTLDDMELVNMCTTAMAILTAGALVTLGSRHGSGRPSAVDGGSATESPLYYCGAVGLDTASGRREYLLGRAVGREERWEESALELVRALEAWNDPEPRLNWNIRCLRHEADIAELELDALQLQEIGSGKFPMIWVNLVHVEGAVAPEEWEKLEVEFDLRHVREMQPAS